MANDNEDQRNDDNEQDESQRTRRSGDAPNQGGVTPAVQGPGVPPITSAPLQGQGASAWVQPAQTVPDGDPRFAIKDAGTPYVVGLGHVSTNPTQYRNDQEQAEKDRENSEENNSDQEDSDENSDEDEDENS